MATKKSAAAADDDLLGGTPGDDLLDSNAKPSKTKGKGKPAAKAAKGKPVAKAAKADKPAAKAAKADKPAAKAPRTPSGPRGAKGTGKFYFPVEEMEALQKKVSSLKKPTSTKEIAEKFEVPTWRARLAAAALVKNGKGTLEKSGSVLVFTP